MHGVHSDGGHSEHPVGCLSGSSPLVVDYGRPTDRWRRIFRLGMRCASCYGVINLETIFLCFGLALRVNVEGAVITSRLETRLRSTGAAFNIRIE